MVHFATSVTALLTELHDFTTNRRANRLGCVLATVYQDGINQVQIKDKAMLDVWQNKNRIPAQAGTRVVRHLPSTNLASGISCPLLYVMCYTLDSGPSVLVF